MKARTTAAGIMILALTAAACSTTKTAEPTAVSVTATSTGTGEDQTFSFDGPATFTGGRVDLTFENADETVHELQLLSLKDGKTIEDLKPVVTNEEDFTLPEWMGIDGGVGGIPAGTTQTAALNLPAGSYAFACFIDGHVARGMLVPVTVTDGETAALPETDGTIEAFDYGFTNEGLVAGEQTVTFENTGEQPHFVAVSRFDPEITLEQVEAEIERYKNEEKPQLGEPEELASIAAIDPGQAITADIALEDGYVYLFACWLPDRAGGPPHFFKGMAEAFEV